MTFEEFDTSLSAGAPPAGLHPLLEALWHERRGDWTKAHEIAQDIEEGDGAWVHAYLHRREGDVGNAGYWYRRAGRRAATGPLDDEWREIAGELLSRL
jgi:hypothetical protein